MLLSVRIIISNNDPKAVDLGSQTSSINDIFVKNLLVKKKIIRQ